MEAIKTYCVNKLLSKSNEFAGILEFEKFTCTSYIFLNPSFESYVKRERLSKARVIKYWISVILSILYTTKYAVLSVYSEEWLLVLFGEFIYKMYKIKIMAYLLLTIGCVSSLDLLMHAYFETRHKFHCLDLLYHLSRKSRAYRLEANNEKKYSVSSYLLFEVLFRHLMTILTILLVGGFTFSAIMAYLDSAIEHNTIRLTINLVLLIIYLRQAIFINLSESFLLFLSLLYIHFKFIEIIEGMKKSIKKKNRIRMYGSIIKHNRATDLTCNLSNYGSIIIGFVFTFGPSVLVIVFTCATDQALNPVIRAFFGLLFFIVCLICYNVNLMAASISSANKSVAKHLYPIFIENRFNHFYLNMKIDSFIARLNKQYIGFYCFNLFKFTKLAFFEFFYALIFIYIIITKIDRKLH